MGIVVDLGAYREAREARDARERRAGHVRMLAALTVAGLLWWWFWRPAR